MNVTGRQNGWAVPPGQSLARIFLVKGREGWKASGKRVAEGTSEDREDEYCWEETCFARSKRERLPQVLTSYAMGVGGNSPRRSEN